MSLFREDYAQEIFTSLRTRGTTVRHVVLRADRDTSIKRIHEDHTHSDTTRAFRLSKLDAYLERLYHLANRCGTRDRHQPHHSWRGSQPDNEDHHVWALTVPAFAVRTETARQRGVDFGASQVLELRSGGDAQRGGTNSTSCSSSPSPTQNSSDLQPTDPAVYAMLARADSVGCSRWSLALRSCSAGCELCLAATSSRRRV